MGATCRFSLNCQLGFSKTSFIVRDDNSMEKINNWLPVFLLKAVICNVLTKMCDVTPKFLSLQLIDSADRPKITSKDKIFRISKKKRFASFWCFAANFEKK